MACRICGEASIKAHLIPKAFVNQIKATPQAKHAVYKPGKERFETFNHGRYDPDLLCGKHDGVLGSFEGKAFSALNLGRAESVEPWGTLALQISPSDLLLFLAAIVWKYSASKKYSLNVGSHEAALRDALFEGGALPPYIDGWGARIVTGEDKPFYYREPHSVRESGVNFWRFSMGGYLFCMKLDQRGKPASPPSRFWFRMSDVPLVGVVPLERSPDREGFTSLKKEGQLFNFISRHDKQQ